MNQEIDQLVDMIASRVKARMGNSGPSSAASDEPCGKCAICPSASTKPLKAIMEGGGVRLGTTPGNGAVSCGVAQYIDHTLLKPEATRSDIEKVCAEARQWNFKTVCLNAANIGIASRLLAGSSVMPIAVVGFPLGASTPQAKAFEAKEAVRNGAQEIDMVINIGALKSKDYKTVLDDITAVVKASSPKPVKVILETHQLTRDEKVLSCVLSKVAGAAFVKTSTGFTGGGATVEDIALMRSIVGDDMGVKASGGIRSREDADKMIAAGADRLGASASVTICQGGKSKGSY
jgi:deoxyribose-phosphate aldolase